MNEMVAVMRDGVMEAVNIAPPVRAAEAVETRSSIHNPATSLADVNPWNALFDQWRSASGISVTVDRAMGVSPVWAAVNFISSTIASLPLHVYRMAGDDRELAKSLPVYSVLHDDVNPEMSSFEWRKLMMQSILLHGRAFALIERNQLGQVMNFWYLDPHYITVEKADGRTRYRYREDGFEAVYEAHQIIDLSWMLHLNGKSHYRPVDQLKNALGLAIALEEYASTFFQNGGVPPLQLVGPMQSPGSIERARTDITAALKAARSEGNGVLPMPMMHELKPIGFDPEKGQLTDARRFQLEEVARIYQLPPVFIQDLSKATLSNSEQQDLHFVKHTLMHWITHWEQQLNLKLFGPRNRKRFVKFNVDALLRGDLKARIESYARGIQNGIYTMDEVRVLEEMSAKGGDAGKLHVQGATVPLGEQKKSAPMSTSDDPAGPPDEPTPDEDEEGDDDAA